MSMRLIYGRAGTGKSQFILNEIKTLTKNNLSQKIFIIVPEQFSYVTEKRLIESLDTNASINAEVISFKRLANRVFTEVGGLTKTNLTKAGKTMLVEYILEKNKKKLNFIGKSDDKDLILRTITELKKHSISNKMLEEQVDKTENQYLKLKLVDISKVYTLYEESIKNNYIDEDDILTILGDKIKYSNIFDESIIYIDEFSGFTEQEYKIISEILKKANLVNLSICADKIEKESPETDIFYTNKQVIEKLLEICKNEHIKIEEPIELKGNFRFKNDELKALEKNIYNIKYKIFDKKVEHIHLSLYENPYSEIESIAKKIIKLVQENNIRYKDISILTKNIDEYKSIIKVLFKKYNIPIFIDDNKELSDNILAKYVLSIFELFDKNWSYDSVWSYIKTGFIDIKNDDIYLLENYCQKWGIRGNKWYKEDWTYDSLNMDLEKINTLRKKIVDPLLKLKKDIENKNNAKEMTKKLYQFLEENKVKEKLQEKIKLLNVEEENTYAKEYIASWDILMQIFDEINLVFAEQKISFENYRRILKSALEIENIGRIPEIIDQVIIGDVERSRNHKVHTLFILGLNDGVFPSTNFDEGFLNDNDRDYLKKKGIVLAKGSLENIYEEQFNIYKAFTTAENDIYLSYVSSDKEGKAKRPSILLNKIKRIFPELKEESDVVSKQISVVSAETTYVDLLKQIRKYENGEEIEDLWVEIYNWYLKNDKWKKRLIKSIKGYKVKNNTEKITKMNIQKLYGSTLKTSISRLEQYRKCPFSFYLKYGLKLKEKEDLKIKPIDTGSFMHDIIDAFFENVKDIKQIKEEDIENIVKQIINEKLSLSKNYIFTSTPKFVVLTNRLKKVIIQSIKYIVFELQNGDFEILGNELEFKKKIDNIEISGKIDRLDGLNTKERKIY